MRVGSSAVGLDRLEDRNLDLFRRRVRHFERRWYTDHREQEADEDQQKARLEGYVACRKGRVQVVCEDVGDFPDDANRLNRRARHADDQGASLYRHLRT